MAVPGGPGGWDWMLVDAPRHRLLASHPGTKTLAVLDLKTKALTQVPTGVAINGIAVDAADNKLFTAGGGEKVVVFDNTTLAKTGEIALTGPGDDIVLDPKTDTLYVCHDDGAEDWVDQRQDQRHHRLGRHRRCAGVRRLRRQARTGCTRTSSRPMSPRSSTRPPTPSRRAGRPRR